MNNATMCFKLISFGANKHYVNADLKLPVDLATSIIVIRCLKSDTT